MQAFLANQITAALAPLLPKCYPVTVDDINELLLGVELPDGTVFGGVAFLTTSPKRILVPTVFVAFQGGTFKGFSNLWNDEGAITLFFSQPQPLEWEKTVVFSSGGGSQVQSDWNQADDTQPDYIKNKPTIPSGIGIIDSSTDFGTISYGESYSTEAAAAEAFGVSAELFRAIITGSFVGPLRFTNGDGVTMIWRYNYGSINVSEDGIYTEIIWRGEQESERLYIEVDTSGDVDKYTFYPYD